MREPLIGFTGVSVLVKAFEFYVNCELLFKRLKFLIGDAMLEVAVMWHPSTGMNSQRLWRLRVISLSNKFIEVVSLVLWSLVFLRVFY